MSKQSNEYRYNLTYGASPKVFGFSKALRQTMTKAEKELWEHIRNKKLGKKFRRQHPIGNYIADFYCHECKLVIEVDGTVHDQKHVKERDIYRETKMQELGLKILRFRNEDVMLDIRRVIREIQSEIDRG